MTLKEKIQEDLKASMRAADKAKVRVLRMVTAAIKQREVDERIELDEAQTLTVLEKMLKQRRDAAKQYIDAGRDDLAAVEQAELGVISEFMPEALSADEINTMIDAAISETGAQSIKDMGKVMAILKPKVRGRTDMGELSTLVRENLG